MKKRCNHQKSQKKVHPHSLLTPLYLLSTTTTLQTVDLPGNTKLAVWLLLEASFAHAYTAFDSAYALKRSLELVPPWASFIVDWMDFRVWVVAGWLYWWFGRVLEGWEGFWWGWFGVMGGLVASYG